MSNEQQGNAQSSGRQALDMDMDKFLDGQTQAVGKDIEPGTYPAVFGQFSKPFMMSGKFGTTKNFDLEFVILDKEGDCVKVPFLCTIPDSPGQINVRSNLFKALKAIDRSKLDEEGKRFKDGVKLSAFIGAQCTVTIEKNDRDFPKVVSIGAKMDGLKYPSKKQVETTLGDDVSFP